MKQEIISIRVESPLRDEVERVADYIQQTSSNTSRMLIQFALDHVKAKPFTLLEHVQKNKFKG